VLREVGGMGITMVIATHLLADLSQVCDSVAVLREGRLASVLPLAAALGRDGRGRRRLRVELAPPDDEGATGVVAGHELVAGALREQPGVLDVAEATGGLQFVYEGDRAGLAMVLERLVGTGARVTQFGHGTEQMDELAAALAEGDGKAD
jgi:ABC-type multidrug transport system ATPase subunit